MSKYPKVKFGDFVEHVLREIELEADKDYPSVGVKWYGEGVHVHEVKSGGSFNAARFEIKENDIIYNDMWARNGSVAIVPPHLDGAVASSHFPTFLPDTSRVLPKYLHYYFKTPIFWDDCENASRGSTGRNQIKKSTFYAIEIPLPSIDEQNCIIERIEALSSRITRVHSLRDEADLEANVLLASIKAKLFSTDEKTTVKDFATVQSGYAFKSDWFTSEGIRLVRNVNIGHGEIRWIDTARIPMERQKEFPDFELKEGDVLISLDRPLISTGLKATRVTQKDLPSLLLQRVGRVIFKNNHVLPEYFYEWLHSPCFTSSIDPGRSNGVPHISPKDIEKVPFSAPPLDEQRRIVAYLDSVQARLASLRELQSATGEELSALLPSVLDRAFKGEL